TVLVVASSTETLLLPKFARNTRLVMGLAPAPMGPVPTGTVAMTALLVPSMTETLFDAWLAVKIRLFVGFTAIPVGNVPTVIGAPSRALAVVSNTTTAFWLGRVA